MKLTKVCIENFRSFGTKQIVDMDSTTLLIGGNSTGKTAFLAALSKLFSQESQQRALRRSDFHIKADEDPESVERKSLSIEAIFDLGSIEEDLDKLSAASFFDGATPDPETGGMILRVRLDAEWTRSSNPDGSIDSEIRYVMCPQEETPDEGNYRKAKRSELDGIRLIYVPASRDPEEQLKGASSGLMRKILSTYRWDDVDKKVLQESVTDINNRLSAMGGVDELSGFVGSVWAGYDSDARYNKVTLEFYKANIDDSLKKPDVVFEPSVTERPFTTKEIGDGLRSLLYFSLIESMLKLESEIWKKRVRKDECKFDHIPPVFTLLAVEEPENHISPHLLGRLVRSLTAISDGGDGQVVVTSHSPSIAKRVEPESIRHLLLDGVKLESVCRPILVPEKTDEAYKFIKGAVRSYPELYFSDLVILGEGESEELILPRILSCSCIDLDSSNISVVPLAGRHVNHFWKLLADLEIPSITLLDLDLERDGGGWGRIAYALEQLQRRGVDLGSFTKADGDAADTAYLDAMKQFEVNEIDDLRHWLDQLESHGVFYSYPLDIDLAMLMSFPDVYKDLADQGPRVPDAGFVRDLETDRPDDPSYLEKVKRSIGAVLHASGGEGNSYVDEQRRLMVWYKYFFLDKGKPCTHVAALAEIEDQSLRSGMPAELKRLTSYVERLCKHEQ